MRIGKISFLCLQLMLCSTLLWSQSSSWEAGWQLYSSRPLPPGINFTISDHTDRAFLNGMMIKHKSESFKQRLNIQYISETEIDDLTVCCDFPVFNPTSYEGLEMAIGIEKGAFWGPLEYYFLLDLNMGLGQYKAQNNQNFTIAPEVFNLRYRSLGAAAGGGLGLWIARRVALNWELRWPGTFYKTRGTYVSFTVQPTGREPGEGLIWQDAPESYLSLLFSFW